MRIGVGAVVVLVVLALVCSVLITAFSPVGVTTTLGPAAASDETGPGGPSSPAATGGPTSTAAPRDSVAAPAPTTGAVLLVHVLGAVVAPGVYELAEGARVFDAVSAAGGLTDQADQSSINLARPVVDGEQLRVLAAGETPPPAPPGGGASVGAAAGGAGGASDAAGAGETAAAPGAVVNLNSATELDLDGLPRIGPAMAARIIAWRTANGPFTAVDDLLQVTGIGEKTLESLRPLVTV